MCWRRWRPSKGPPSGTMKIREGSLTALLRGGAAGGVEGVNNLISAITSSAWLLSPCSQPATKTDLNLQHLVAACLRPAPRICIFIIDWCWRLFRLFVCSSTRLQCGSFAYNLYWAWLAWPPLLIWTHPLWGFAWKYIAYTHIYCRYQHHGTSAFCTEKTDNITATSGAHSRVQWPVPNQQISSQPPVSSSPGQRKEIQIFWSKSLGSHWPLWPAPACTQIHNHISRAVLPISLWISRLPGAGIKQFLSICMVITNYPPWILFNLYRKSIFCKSFVNSFN